MAMSNDPFDERNDLRYVLSDSQVHRWRQNLGESRDAGTKVTSKLGTQAQT